MFRKPAGAAAIDIYRHQCAGRLLLPEPLSGRAQRALHKEDERAISWLVEAELVSALARKVRSRGMRRADGPRFSEDNALMFVLRFD